MGRWYKLRSKTWRRTDRNVKLKNEKEKKKCLGCEADNYTGLRQFSADKGF